MNQFDLFEQWLPINGCDGYFISTFGECRTVTRTVIDKNGNKHTIRGKKKIPHDNGKGYLAYNINNKHVYAHRIVAETFIPNPENKPEVDHIDGNRCNNCVWNLRWVTKRENQDNPITKRRNKVSHDSQKKSVIQLDLNGNYIKKWVGIGEAARFLGIRRTEIVGILSTNRASKTINGWQFVYEEDYDPSKDYRIFYKNGTSKNALIPTMKMVVEVKNGKIVHIHKDTVEASKFYNVTFGYISRICREHGTVKKFTHKNKKLNAELCYFKDLPDNLKNVVLSHF